MFNVQQALLAGPGRFGAVCLYSSPREPEVQQIRRAAARLISFFEDTAHCPDNLRVLVALAPAHLDGKVAPGGSKEAITTIGGGRFKIGDAAVFVQISAQSDVHRLYALRVVDEVLRPVLLSCREILGARILNGQETFGFQDGTEGRGNYSLSVAKALPADGAWLFFQRFCQNAIKFFSQDQTPLAKAQVVGIPPMGTGGVQTQVRASLAEAPAPNAHVTLMKVANPTIIRRGFPCRCDGEEGLAFVGVVPAFDTIPQLLSRIINSPDALLPFIDGREGGLFYCPPSAQWLGAGDEPRFEPVTTGPLSNAGHLISYDTTTAFYEYLMLLKERGVFDEMNQPRAISFRARKAVDDLYRSISDTQDQFDELKHAELNAFGQAVDVNAGYDQYITFA
jgi:deferrochelatase/peroxidase EfeB